MGLRKAAHGITQLLRSKIQREPIAGPNRNPPVEGTLGPWGDHRARLGWGGKAATEEPTVRVGCQLC